MATLDVIGFCVFSLLLGVYAGWYITGLGLRRRLKSLEADSLVRRSELEAFHKRLGLPPPAPLAGDSGPDRDPCC